MIDRQEMEQIVNQTLEFEGGYVNNRHDPGGETKFGISQKSYPTLNIKALTREWAREIYIEDFLLDQKLNYLNDRGLAAQIFDMTVNIGKSAGGKIVQRALNICGYRVVVDGIIGPKTIEALNRCKTAEIRPLILSMLLSYYVGIYEQNKDDKSESKRIFYRDCLKAWSKRALKAAEVASWIN